MLLNDKKRKKDSKREGNVDCRMKPKSVLLHYTKNIGGRALMI